MRRVGVAEGSANTAGADVASASVAASSMETDMDASNNTAQVTVTVSTPPPPSNGSSGGSSGGGGGSIGYATLLFSLLMAVVRAYRAR